MSTEANDIPNEYGFVRYRMYDATKHQSSLSCAEYTKWNILDIYRAIIKKEQPITIEDLSKRVAPIHGCGKVTPVFKNQVKDTVKRYLKHEIVIYRHEYVCMIDNAAISVRFRTEDGFHQRNIGSICHEEMMQALKLVLAVDKRLSKESLLRNTARALGFLRCGFVIKYRLAEALDCMIKRGDVLGSDAFLRLNPATARNDYKMGDYQRNFKESKITTWNDENSASSSTKYVVDNEQSEKTNSTNVNNLHIIQQEQADPFSSKLSVKETIPLCVQEIKVVEEEKENTHPSTTMPVFLSKSNYTQDDETNSGKKSFVITLILSIIPIPLGLHRFYTGHIITGIIQLFTCGFNYIWSFADFLLIVTNNFRDSKGKKLRGYNLLISLLFFAVWAFFWGMIASFFVAISQHVE